MKWLKHDTDANQDAKLQNVLLDYGLEGYGLYWYCIELIAGKVDKDNITFELEHDARIIARNVGSTAQKVEEMMRYFVELGLFEDSQGTITCLKLARRLDKSMTSNPEMRSIIENLKSHDSIMTQSEKPMQDKIRLDKNRKDKPLVKPEAKRGKFKFNDDQMNFASAVLQKVILITPAMKSPNLDSWANTARLMNEVDGIELIDAWNVFCWANADSFWSTNILSVAKLRDKYAVLCAKMNGKQSSSEDIMQQSANSDWHKGDLGL